MSAKPKRQAIRMFSRASSSKLMSVALFVIFLKELNFDVEAMETLQMLKQIPKLNGDVINNNSIIYQEKPCNIKNCI